MGIRYGSGSEFSLDWAGHEWRLCLGGPAPGLKHEGTGAISVLTLDGLAGPGRRDVGALGRGSLVGAERFRSRVQATYAPPGWGGLQVRASWSPAADGEGVDLEVQVAASSVGELRAVEVLVGCALALGEEPEAGVEIEVQPRDRRAAGLSYDGREADGVLRRLHTAALPDPGVSRVVPACLSPAWSGPAGTILQMVHPDDVARRMIWRSRGQGRGTSRVVATRDGLFGHDLEKGVVVRGRLRVLWVSGPVEPAPDLLERAFRHFLDAPPPLGM